MTKYFMQNKTTLVILFSEFNVTYNNDISLLNGDENVMNIVLTNPENDWADMPLTAEEEKALLEGRKNMKKGNFLTLQEFKTLVQMG